MKTAAWLLLAIGGGLFAWAIGSRLSTDAVGMGVGLVFGVLAGIPAALLVLATGRQSQGGGYDAGYTAGTRDAQRAEFEWAAARLVERQSAELQQGQRPAVIVVNPPADDDDDDIDGGIEPYYSLAYPFGHQRQFRITGEVEQ